MDYTQENRVPFKNDIDYSGYEDSVSKSRRSSILKPPKTRAPLLDVNFSNKKDNDDFDANRKRRVSFAGVNKVREFNSKDGTIHVSCTPSYDESFSSDSSGMSLSETCGHHSQAEDAKTEKEAKLIMNIISGDDSLHNNESMDITNCSYNENDAKIPALEIVDGESNDNAEVVGKNESSFNPRLFDCLKENQEENNCGNYSLEPQDESQSGLDHCISEGMDLTQPILSDKMRESLADMSLEPNLVNEMQFPSDLSSNTCVKKTFDHFLAVNDNQPSPNILHCHDASNKITEKSYNQSIETVSKEVPKQIVCGQLKKITHIENISSENQTFVESSLKISLEARKCLPVIQFNIDSDLNNSVNMEFTEAVHRFENVENKLSENQQKIVSAEIKNRKSFINTLNIDNLDNSNMEITEVGVLKGPEGIGSSCTKMPDNNYSPSDSCASKPLEKIFKGDNPLTAQDSDCTLNTKLTAACIVKPYETSFSLKIASKNEGMPQKEGITEIPLINSKSSSRSHLQDYDCSAMECTETYVNKAPDEGMINIFKGTVENTAKLTGKEGNEAVIAEEIVMHENDSSSNVKFTNACSPKSFYKLNNDHLLKHDVVNERALEKSTQSLLVPEVGDPIRPIFQDQVLNCTMEFTEVCLPKPCRKSISFFRPNEYNPNSSSNMEFTEACLINPLKITRKSIPPRNDNERSSNMEFTEVCEKKPCNSMPFTKFGEKSDMEFTETYVGNSPNVPASSLLFKKNPDFSSNMKFTELCQPIPPGVSRNSLLSNRDSKLSTSMEFTEACLAKQPSETTDCLPFTKRGELIPDMDAAEDNVVKVPEETKNSLLPTKSCNFSSNMEFTEACKYVHSDVSRNATLFSKNNELSSNMELTEACSSKLPGVSRGALPFSKNGELPSDMEFTEACMVSSPNVVSPLLKDRVLSSSIKCVKESETNSVVSKHYFSSAKSNECSTGMEFTNILATDDKKENNSRVSNIEENSSNREFEKNSVNVLDNIATSSFHNKFGESERSNISVALTDNLQNVELAEKLSEFVLEKSVQNTSGANQPTALNVKLDVGNDHKYQESTLINFDQNIRATPHLKGNTGCGITYSTAECIIADSNKNLDIVKFHPGNDEPKEYEKLTVAKDNNFSENVMSNEAAISSEENMLGSSENSSVTLLHSECLDNEKSVNMDMTCNSFISCNNNDEIPVRNKAKLDERNNHFDIEESRVTKKIKIDMESNNENLSEAISIDLDLCSKKITEINDLQQDQLKITNEKHHDSQKNIEIDLVEKEKSFYDLSPNIDEHCNASRIMNLIEVEAFPLKENEITKNVPKNIESNSYCLDIHQGIQPVDLLDSSIPNSPCNVNNTEHNLVPHPGLSDEDHMVAQDNDLYCDSSKILSDNSAILVNADSASSTVSVQISEKILSRKSNANEIAAKEECSDPQRVKQDLISNSYRISPVFGETNKGVETEKLLFGCTLNKNDNTSSENEVNPSEPMVNDICEENKIETKSLQVRPTVTIIKTFSRKTGSLKKGILDKEDDVQISSSFVQSLGYRSSMEQYKLNVQNLKFMKNLGFLRISFTEWRYCLTEILSITIQVPSGRIDEATCLKKVYYSVDKHADAIHLYISDVITKRYTEEWLKSECLTVKDVLQTSDIIMKERLEIKKFYMSLNYLHRFYPCKLSKNRISFYIVDLKAKLKFDVNISIDGWKKIKIDNIKVISDIGHFREPLVRKLFCSVPDDEKRLINFVRMLEDYCKSQSNII
ncbi:uncharacterized protein isoform X2 [Rhodnius prolixus]|uniref:uncharacterized protein isoform X2 n=1 Tax=Rhodnius prolixus TaxID=13249 RepID=UPI003D18BFA2